MKPASMPALILLPFIATTLVTSEHTFSASPDEVAGSLQSSLASGGLEEPQILSSILRELGLSSVQDVWLLNVPEQLELAESLRLEGINLGSRSKLRRLSEDSKEATGLLNDDSGCHSQNYDRVFASADTAISQIGRAHV